MAIRDTRGIFKVDPKVELKDYSGPFKPDLRFSDFSREQLARMHVKAHEYFMEVAFYFSVHIAEKYGIDAMGEAHHDVWIKKLGPSTHRLLTEGMGIKGNDIESLMKVLQTTAIDWGPLKFDVTFEMPSKDRGVVTIYKCPGVDIYEAAGDEGMLAITKEACATDRAILMEWAKLFHPDMVAKDLVLPPRKSKDDPCCKWEFTYKNQSKCLDPAGPATRHG